MKILDSDLHEAGQSLKAARQARDHRKKELARATAAYEETARLLSVEEKKFQSLVEKTLLS